VFLLPAFVLAQHVISVRSGLVSRIVGDVYLDGDRIVHSSDQNHEVLDGMSLRTESGLAEIQLGAGAFIRSDQDTLIRMEDSSLDNTSLRLEHGSVLIEIFQIYEGNSIRLHFNNALIVFEREGLYRLDANRNQLSVYGGKAVVRNPCGKASVKGGRSLDLLTLSIRKFNVGKKDAFHYWAAYRSFNQNLQFLKMGWHSSHWKTLLMDCYRNEDYRVTFKDKDKEDSTRPPEEQENRLLYELNQEMDDILRSIESLKNDQ